jgi:hypothetical protein
MLERYNLCRSEGVDGAFLERILDVLRLILVARPGRVNISDKWITVFQLHLRRHRDCAQLPRCIGETFQLVAGGGDDAPVTARETR